MTRRTYRTTELVIAAVLTLLVTTIVLGWADYR